MKRVHWDLRELPLPSEHTARRYHRPQGSSAVTATAVNSKVR
jgi:hypothetical protein